MKTLPFLPAWHHLPHLGRGWRWGAKADDRDDVKDEKERRGREWREKIEKRKWKRKNCYKNSNLPLSLLTCIPSTPPLFPISIQTPNHSLSRGQVSNARCDWPRACPKWSGFADSLKYVFARPRYCTIFSLYPRNCTFLHFYFTLKSYENLAYFLPKSSCRHN